MTRRWSCFFFSCWSSHFCVVVVRVEGRETEMLCTKVCLEKKRNCSQQIFFSVPFIWKSSSRGVSPHSAAAAAAICAFANLFSFPLLLRRLTHVRMYIWKHLLLLSTGCTYTVERAFQLHTQMYIRRHKELAVCCYCCCSCCSGRRQGLSAGFSLLLFYSDHNISG